MKRRGSCCFRISFPPTKDSNYYLLYLYDNTFSAFWETQNRENDTNADTQTLRGPERRPRTHAGFTHGL